MAYPPPVLPINRTNATPQQDTHPQDHNSVNLAINDIVSKIAGIDATMANLAALIMSAGPGRSYGSIRSVAQVTLNGSEQTILTFTVPALPPGRLVWVEGAVGFWTSGVTAPIVDVFIYADGFRVVNSPSRWQNGALTAAASGNDSVHAAGLFTTAGAAHDTVFTIRCAATNGVLTQPGESWLAVSDRGLA